MASPGFGRRVVLVIGVVSLLSGGDVEAQCPGADAILGRLGQLGLERGARTASFSVPPPQRLYEKAAKKPGEVASSRDGAKGLAVAVVSIRIEPLWKAINDEANHADGGYLMVDRSEVVGGTSRGQSRQVFQSGSKMGIGRWWVTRTRMNAELFAATQGMLWESIWDGTKQPEEPPVSDPPDLSPVKSTQGAWLLARIDEGCTLVEHFSWSEPGGFAGAMQGPVLGKALRGAVEGMARLASERYAREPPPGPPFVRPDGQPLD
jgi:hypothetical protein